MTGYKKPLSAFQCVPLIVKQSSPVPPKWIRCRGTTSPQAVSSFPAHVINTPGWWGRRWKHPPVKNLWCCLRYTRKNKPRQELIHMVTAWKAPTHHQTRDGKWDLWCKTHIFQQIKKCNSHSLQPSVQCDSYYWLNDGLCMLPGSLWGAVSPFSGITETCKAILPSSVDWIAMT